MPKKKPSDAPEILEEIADKICAIIKEKFGIEDEEEALWGKYQIWKENSVTVKVRVNDQRNVYVRVEDGKCRVWSDKSVGITLKYTASTDQPRSGQYVIFELSDPESFEKIEREVEELVAKHVIGIFMQNIQIVHQLEQHKKEELKVFNQVDYPHYSGTSQHKSRMDEVLRSNQYQEFMFEQMKKKSEDILWAGRLLGFLP